MDHLTRRSARVVALELLPAGTLALSACGSDAPFMNIAGAEEKAKAYASAALAVLPDKGSVKIPTRWQTRTNTKPGGPNPPRGTCRTSPTSCAGVSESEVQDLLGAVRQRLKKITDAKQKGVAVGERDRESHAHDTFDSGTERPAADMWSALDRASSTTTAGSLSRRNRKGWHLSPLRGAGLARADRDAGASGREPGPGRTGGVEERVPVVVTRAPA